MLKWAGLFLIGFVGIFTALLFATGVAQKHLIPVLKQQAASRPKAPAESAGAEGTAGPAAARPAAAAADSAAVRPAEAPAAPVASAPPASDTAVKGAVARAVPQPRTAEQQKGDAALAKIYAEMKPEDAAKILRQLDDATALAIVSHLKADKAARLLEAFGPERSVRLTLLWAGMSGAEGARP